MKGKDLWDMRDLSIPSREDAERGEVRQNVRNTTISLSEWGEKSDFWKEWKDEFQIEGASPQANVPALRKQQEPDIETHENDEDVFLEPWAAQLAFHERRLEKEGTADYGIPFRRQELLVDKTKEFARVLQHNFRKHVEHFNQARKSAAHAIHIYKISRSDEDFLMYRNGVKLIVSAQRAGRITLSFNQFIAPMSQTDKHAHVELEAVWGPFDQLLWTYKGERVQMMDIVRYFVSEIAFQSFR